MQRDQLVGLATFINVAEHLSFRIAASRLGVTPSALSHSMRQLEDRLGTRLLHRTTRSVSLTDAGVRLLEALRPAIDQITHALNDLNGERCRPVGRLRLYVTQIAAMAVIAPVWKRFLSAYPEVSIELEIGERPVDIVKMGFDAGIGPLDRAATDMIAVQVIGPVKAAIVGASSYFGQRRTPRVPNDLANHNCIAYRRGSDGLIYKWRFQRNGKTLEVAVNGPVVVNTTDLAVRAALDGLGIAYAYEAQVEPFLRSGQLVRVLEDWTPSTTGLHLYYSGHQQVPAALRALIDMIRASHSVDPAELSLSAPFTPD